MRPRCVMPRLAPSPITLARSSRAGDADRVVGAVADLLVGLRSRRGHRCRCRRRTADRPAPSGSRSSPPAASPCPWRGRSASCASRRQRDLLRASAGRRRRPSRSAPCRSPASSSAAARTAAARSAKLCSGSGSGSMKMSRWSKAATQLGRVLAQHAVAEHVARHVADADHGERRRARCRCPSRGNAASPTSQAPRAVMPIFLWS